MTLQLKTNECQETFCALVILDPQTKYFLTEQSFTERSGLQKLKKWMGFCVLKALNSFFQLSWKEKTCLLSAANIEYENFKQKILLCAYNPLFELFLQSLRKPKNVINQPILIFLSNFSCSIFTADKRHVFSFHENRKN